MGLLKNLLVRIKGDSKDLKSELKSSETSISTWSKRIAGFFAAAFSVGIIANFAKEVIGLAAKAEGIKTAFQALNNPLLLSQLRKATRGTVDDVTLMQKAVQARNFKIPLQQLATYFEFATKRAIQTGESVDYLVESIITGIGRKSVLVMDNLGISAVALQDEIERTGDFATAAGNIIEQELTDMGDVADTTVIKIESISTAWKNLKTGIGEKITASKGFQSTISFFSDFGKILQQPGMTFSQALMASLFMRKEIINDIEEGEKRITEEYNKQAGAISRVSSARTVIYAPPSQGSFSHLGFPDMGVAAPGLSGTHAGDAITEELQRRVDAWNEILLIAKQDLVSSATDITEGLFAAMSSGNWTDFGSQLLEGFADFLSMLGKLLISFAIAESGFLAASKNPLAWPIALAAGIAAIAAAGLIRGAIAGGGKSITSGYSGGGGAQPGAGQLKVVIEGKLVGKDIYWSGKRYEDELNTGT